MSDSRPLAATLDRAAAAVILANNDGNGQGKGILTLSIVWYKMGIIKEVKKRWLKK